MSKFYQRRKTINTKRRIIFYSLFFLLFFITVGYSYMSTSLTINGHTELSANNWNIHFANLNVTTGSVTASTPATISGNSTTINYSITLNHPNDYYEFTINEVNNGTIPAKISSVSLSGIGSNVAANLSTSINYTNGTAVAVGDGLNPNSSKGIIVRVYYDANVLGIPGDTISLNLTFNITYELGDNAGETASNLLQDLQSTNSCITKYTGQVTEQVGLTTTANNIYFNNCSDKRNIIFGGFCWEVIRTTETGGMKLLYNGEPVNGKCESTRGNHKGIIGTTGDEKYLNSSVVYGKKFTYNLTNNTFTLVDTFTSTWSDSTYRNLLGTYTCYNNSTTCTTLFSINGYTSSTTAYTTSYTIDNTNYSNIGNSPFNAQYSSTAMVGYKYNKVYHFQRKHPGTTSYKYGNSFTYNSNTHTYTLSGTSKTINNWTTGYTQLNNTHYTCWNTGGSCATISYVYYTNETDAVYFDITDGKSVGDVLVEMLSENDVNYYNSTIKGYIDAWYEHNLTSYTNKIEDTVYCNDRTILDLAAFNPNGGDTVSNFWMTFKNYNQTTSLVCSSLTDQFAVSNNKAKLTYPIALITTEELSNLNSPSLRAKGYWYHNLTPNYYASAAGFDYAVAEDGTISYVSTDESGGVRPAISISSDAVITGGTGTETDPWIAE